MATPKPSLLVFCDDIMAFLTKLYSSSFYLFKFKQTDSIS